MLLGYTYGIVKLFMLYSSIFFFLLNTYLLYIFRLDLSFTGIIMTVDM